MLILRVWRKQPGQYFCLSTKDRGGRWKDHFFKRSQLKQVPQFVKDNTDKDVYWCPHGFTKPRRLAEYSVLPSLCWSDLDEADPRRMKPQPTIAWQSSPGRFVGLWITDKPITLDINRRLTYYVEGDRGCWNLGRVLRVPSTFNYKYPNTPRVRMLWQDGPTFAIKELEHLLGKTEDPGPDFGDAHAIYQKYSKKMSPYCRRELMTKKVPKPGKRSEVLWRLNNELAEAGMTEEERFIILRVSKWNKFAGRTNGDAQLRREIQKATSQKFETAHQVNEEDPEAEDFQFLNQTLADVELRSIDWLWYPYLARREITILEGDPGLGKSYLAQMIGAHIVDGKKLPTVQAHKTIKGKVAYFDIENDAPTVTKRRLVDNNCRNLADYYQEETPFSIDDEGALDAVYEALERVRPDLVVFDTLNTYIGMADTYKASEVTQALNEFKEIAKRFNCSVIVVRHLTKNTKIKAIYRGQGSIAATGAARVVVTVGSHPDEADVCVMAVTKLNIGPKPLALTFEIQAIANSRSRGRKNRSRFVWGDFVELTSDEIVIAAPAKTRGKRDQVENFLQEILADGPMKKQNIERAAEARGVSMKTLYRVAKDIGIVMQQQGWGEKKYSVWSLQEHEED